MVPNIGLFDISLGVIFLILIYFISIKWIKRNTENETINKWFIPALTSKIVGGIIFSILSVFYYHKGDTFLYFQIADNLRINLFVDFKETLNTIFTSYSGLENISFNPLESYNYYYERPTTWNYSRIILIFNILGLGSYWLTTLIISVTSFIGLWLGFLNFCRLYPNSKKLIFIPFFLIPSVLIWSSGILKDTLIVTSIGVLFYSLSNIAIFKTKLILSLALAIMSLIVISVLRIHLLYFLIPSFLIWVLNYSFQNVISISKRLIYKSLILIGTGVLFVLLISFGDGHLAKYKPENLASTVGEFHSYHTMYNEVKEESTYTLGEVEYTASGLLKKITPALNVTFLRPYVWEVKNYPTLFGAFESLLLFITIVFLCFKNYKTILKNVLTNKEYLFLLLFAICYGFVVGLTSYNFGALSRYKSSCLLFLLLGVIVLTNKGNQSKEVEIK